MYVNHSGWSQKYGSFNYNIYVDENKTDYELVYGDGSIAKQQSPFEYVTADWNHDGDVYTQFGAWFGKPGGSSSEFITPENMVSAILHARELTWTPYGNELIDVRGIEVPPPDKRPSLDDTLRKTELRALHQDIDCNRKMNALGIRPPGEPWAR